MFADKINRVLEVCGYERRRLPPPKEGESEITKLFLTKLNEWRRLASDR